MEKFKEFFAVLTAIRSGVRYEGHRMVKEFIGDSTRNHRTPSVRQMIRLCSENKDKRTAKELEAVYTVMRPFLKFERLNNDSKRTDAYDINELVTVYRDRVMNQGQFRRQIGQALGRV